MQTKQIRWFHIFLMFFLLGQVMPVSATSSPEISVIQTDTKAESQVVTKNSEKKLSAFWIIGIVINLVIFSLFMVWAVKEWRRK